MFVFSGIFDFFRKIFRIRNIRRKNPDPDTMIYEQWNADFTKPSQVRFDIKADFSYDANVRNGSLALGSKKSNCLVWVDDFWYRYADQVIEGNIQLNPHGGYAAAGFIFRMVDDSTYYTALVSNKGYFRLDVVRNGNPQTLIGWTEFPPAAFFNLKIIAAGNNIVLIINSRWAAEIQDSTIPSGRLGFALASYEAGLPGSAYTAEAFLNSFTIESRIEEVMKEYERWDNETAADGLARFHLAETFAAMGQAEAAWVQLRKAWEKPDYRRTQRELLLACRLTLCLDFPDKAEEYAAACITAGADSPEGREALIEKAKIFYMTRRFEALKSFAEKVVFGEKGNATMLTLLGHAYFELKEYGKASEIYDRAFEADGGNGLLAKNAANMYELLDRKEEALERYLQAGRVFLNADNYGDLGALVPKLISLGKENWQAHALTGKWAFGIEDWTTADREFKLAEDIRRQAVESRKNPKKSKNGEITINLAGEDYYKEDSAVSFLRGMLLLREGNRVEALVLFEKAAALAPDYHLFRFKLAENRFLLSGDPNDPAFIADLDAALTLAPEDGWTANLAAQAALSKGDLDSAKRYLETATRSLGDIPAIRVNQGVLYYLRDFPDKALGILSVPRNEDPEGVMANCAGNLLVRNGRFEEADAQYRRALAAAPRNTEFLCNRASCLIELGKYGEADDVLAQAYNQGPSPFIYELIAYVATKKGEYPRAETACRAALDIDPCYIPSLFSLGWMYVSQRRWNEAGEILRRLNELALSGDALTRREELRIRQEEATTRLFSCASCGRTWRVPLLPPPAKPFRLYAMPPDELPAGTCPECGKTYCIGCVKKYLDDSGRFLCTSCNKPLKLINEGLKKIVGDWAGIASGQDS
jgi:tetratricopeptide (TPR) repeat protein